MSLVANALIREGREKWVRKRTDLGKIEAEMLGGWDFLELPKPRSSKEGQNL